jgi:two-component system alkaline phosphatase synthesis response regulator PhoP
MEEVAKRILLIEDDPSLSLIIADRLRAEQFLLFAAMDGQEGYQEGLKNVYDLIILDVMLPKKSGLDVCRDLRANNIRSPILMLTALGQVSDRVVGLKLGADDYLTKPFEMIELSARIEALLRRSTPNKQTNAKSYTFDDVTVDFGTMEVKRNGTIIELTAKEYQLLAYLIEHRGQLMTREAIMNSVWGYETVPNSRTVDTHVAWLRQKLEANPKHPQYILTYRGLGYKFMG